MESTGHRWERSVVAMSPEMFGTVLLVLLIIVCWRSRGAIFPVLVALILGVTISTHGGPLANTSITVSDGLRQGLGALSQSLFGKA
jgi:peptidoglycan/LPS O-acetylase OafA/YrhL